MDKISQYAGETGFLQSMVKIAGIMPPAQRRNIWKANSVIFVSANILLNDLDTSSEDEILGRTILIVIDEAERAQKGHLYCQIMDKFAAKSIRILALCENIGTSMSTVQQIVNNLRIGKIHYFNEESLQLIPYASSNSFSKSIVDLDSILLQISSQFTHSIMAPYLARLNRMEVVWEKDPTKLCRGQVASARDVYIRSRGKSANGALIGQMAVLESLCNAHDILLSHGYRCFLNQLLVRSPSPSSTPTSACTPTRTRIKNELESHPVMKQITQYIDQQSLSIASHPKLNLCLNLLQEHLKESSSSKTLLVARTIAILEISSYFEGNGIKCFAHTKESTNGSEIPQSFFTSNASVLLLSNDLNLNINSVFSLAIFYDLSSALSYSSRISRRFDRKTIVLLAKGREETQYDLHTSQQQKFALDVQTERGLKMYDGSSFQLPNEAVESCIKRPFIITINSSAKSAADDRKGKSSTKSKMEFRDFWDPSAFGRIPNLCNNFENSWIRVPTGTLIIDHSKRTKAMIDIMDYFDSLVDSSLDGTHSNYNVPKTNSTIEKPIYRLYSTDWHHATNFDLENFFKQTMSSFDPMIDASYVPLNESDYKNHMEDVQSIKENANENMDDLSLDSDILEDLLDDIPGNFFDDEIASKLDNTVGPATIVEEMEHKISPFTKSSESVSPGEHKNSSSIDPSPIVMHRKKNIFLDSQTQRSPTSEPSSPIQEKRRQSTKKKSSLAFLDLEADASDSDETRDSNETNLDCDLSSLINDDPSQCASNVDMMEVYRKSIMQFTQPADKSPNGFIPEHCSSQHYFREQSSYMDTSFIDDEDVEDEGGRDVNDEAFRHLHAALEKIKKPRRF